MIYIKELFVPNKSVTIQVDGILDQQSIPILKKVCQNHLYTGIKVLLNLDGLTHIAREGREFFTDNQGPSHSRKLPSVSTDAG